MAKEEKGSTFARALASFKNCVTVELRTQTRVEEHEREQVVLSKQPLEELDPVIGHCNCLINL